MVERASIYKFWLIKRHQIRLVLVRVSSCHGMHMILLFFFSCVCCCCSYLLDNNSHPRDFRFFPLLFSIMQFIWDKHARHTIYIYIYGIWTRIRLVWCDEAMGRMVDDFGETAGMPTIEIVIMACYTCLKIIKFYCNLKLLWLPYHMIVYVLHGGEWVCLISWLCFSPHNYVAQLIINTNAYNNV